MSRPKGHPDELPQEARDKLVAAFHFVQRTGAKAVQLRWSDDEPPVVWMMVAEYRLDKNGRPAKEGTVQYEVDASLDPIRAALRLCERLADGGQCTHCGRPTGFDPDTYETMPLNEVVCWWQWEPGLKRFVRGCV